MKYYCKYYSLLRSYELCSVFQFSTECQHESSSLESRYGGERFLEEHLTAAASSYYQGHLPPLQHFLPSFQLHSTRDKQGVMVSWIRCTCSKMTSFCTENNSSSTPSPYFCSAPDKAVKYLGTDVVRKVKYMYYGMTFSRILLVLLAMLGLFSFTRKETLMVLFPCIVMLSSFACMMISTCAILINYRHLDEFKVWSLVFQHYCPELSTRAAEDKFQNRWFVPYLGMVASLLLILFVKPFVASSVLCFLLPLFVVFSLLASFCSFKRVGVWQHVVMWLHLISSSNNFPPVVQEYFYNVIPTEFHQFYHYIIQFKFEWNLWTGLIMQFDVFSIFHVCWILTLLLCLLRKGSMSAANLLVTSVWCCWTLRSVNALTSPSEAAFPCILWFSVFVYPFVWKVVTATLPVMCLIYLSFENNYSYELVFGVVILYGICYIALLRYSSKFGWLVLQISFWMSISFLLASNFYHATEIQRNTLNWETYHTICDPSKQTEVKTILTCHKLEGTLINWHGTVTEVTVTSITNWPEYLLSLLPVPDNVRNRFACALGQPAPSCNRAELELHEYERCVVLTSVHGKDRCMLEQWNIYEFAVTVTMDSTYWKINKDSQGVVLILPNGFKDVAHALVRGETLEFEGTLSGGVGTKHLQVDVIKLKCSQCNVRTTEEIVRLSNYLYLYEMGTSVLTFIFEPTLIV